MAASGASNFRAHPRSPGAEKEIGGLPTSCLKSCHFPQESTTTKCIVCHCSASSSMSRSQRRLATSNSCCQTGYWDGRTFRMLNIGIFDSEPRHKLPTPFDTASLLNALRIAMTKIITRTLIRSSSESLWIALLALAESTTWSYLDITPLGRQETWEDSPEGYPQTPPYKWWNWHDSYDSNASPDPKWVEVSDAGEAAFRKRDAEAKA